MTSGLYTSTGSWWIAKLPTRSVQTPGVPLPLTACRIRRRGYRGRPLDPPSPVPVRRLFCGLFGLDGVVDLGPQPVDVEG